MDVSQVLQATMHLGSQSLLVPTMVCIVLLVLAMAVIVGSVIAEAVTERRHFKLNNRAAVVALHNAGYDEVAGVVAESALLRYQKELLMGVVGNMGLPDEELYALSQNELAKSDRRYQHRLNLTDTAAKVAPMLGLMGTLIPLGPGIVAMGRGDVATLSSSLLVAFDTTILGLVAAIVAMLVSRIRKTWYADYSSMMRTLTTCLVEKAQEAREEGIELPFGYIDAEHSPLPGGLEEIYGGGEALPTRALFGDGPARESIEAAQAAIARGIDAVGDPAREAEPMEQAGRVGFAPDPGRAAEPMEPMEPMEQASFAPEPDLAAGQAPEPSFAAEPVAQPWRVVEPASTGWREEVCDGGQDAQA